MKQNYLKYKAPHFKVKCGALLMVKFNWRMVMCLIYKCLVDLLQIIKP